MLSNLKEKVPTIIFDIIFTKKNPGFFKDMYKAYLYLKGGGNNIYGDDIIPFLEKIKDSNERNAYILMEKITTPITKNYMVRPGYDKPQFVNVVSELGIFGYIIG